MSQMCLWHYAKDTQGDTGTLLPSNAVGGDRSGRRLPKEVTFKLGLEEPNTEGQGSFQAKKKTMCRGREV